MDEDALIRMRAQIPQQQAAQAVGQVAAALNNPDYRIVTGDVPGLGDMDDLSALPGTPGYYRKMASSSRPAPDEPPPSPILAANGQPLPSMGVNAPEAPALKRVAIGLGRGDDFVVAVEEAPDWEATDSWKISPDRLLALAPILRALGVRIVDRSAGEFRALERGDG